MLNEQQMQQLLTLLAKIADRSYTIAGAADWPLLVVLGGLLIGAIALMWRDLKQTIRDGREERNKAIDSTRQEIEKLANHTARERDLIWQALKECQDDCCPRSGKR